MVKGFALHSPDLDLGKRTWKDRQRNTCSRGTTMSCVTWVRHAQATLRSAQRGDGYRGSRGKVAFLMRRPTFSCSSCGQQEDSVLCEPKLWEKSLNTRIRHQMRHTQTLVG